MRGATFVSVGLFLLIAIAPCWPENETTSLSAVSELRSVRTAYAISVNKEQALAILSAIKPLRKLQAQYAAWAADQWKTAGEKVKAAIAAWAAGRQPDAGQAQVATDLLRTALQKTAKIHQAAEEAAKKAREALGDQPPVESAQAAAERRLAERRFWGARNAAEAILLQAEALRLLMPDDYMLVRVAEAETLADAMAGAQPAPPALVDNILNILDMLVDMPPQNFAATRPQLIADIARRLGLPPQEATIPAVTWDQFVRWLTAPETTTVLEQIAAGKVAAQTAVPAEFATALAQLRVLALTADLRMRPDQTRAFAQLAVEISRTVQAAHSDRVEVGAEALAILPDVRSALSNGKALEGDVADKVQKILAADDDIQRDLKIAMLRYIRQLERLLTPEQRALVDWTPPGDVLRLVPARVRTQRLRRRAALIGEALDFLNRLKYQTAKRYMNLKVSQSQQFVADFVPPDSPDYDQAMQFTLDLVAEARMVPREDWEAGTDVQFATRLMRGLGVLQQPVPPPPTGDELYTWQQLYDILTAPGGAAVFTTQGAKERR